MPGRDGDDGAEEDPDKRCMENPPPTLSGGGGGGFLSIVGARTYSMPRPANAEEIVGVE